MNETEQSETGFTRRIQAELDAGTADFDSVTLARLRQARERAVEAARKQRISPQWRPLSLGFALAAALLAFVTWRLLPGPEHVSPLTPMEDDLEILIAEDEMSFYLDMEFLIWLEQQEHAG